MSAKDQIKQIVDYFKRENYLKDKTDAMGDGLLLGADLADEANERSKNATETTLAVQEKYKEQILAQDLNPNKDPELVDLRNGEQTAGERIAKFEQETTAQLAQIVIDVSKYGAKGDGIADDTEAIRRAIDDMTWGSILYFKKGIYKFTDTLVIKNLLNITLKGDGAGVSRLVNHSTSKSLEFEDCSYLDFDNVGIIGNGIAPRGTGATGGDGIKFTRTSHVMFNGADISFNGGNGINLIEGCWVYNFNNTRIIGNLKNGVVGLSLTELQAAAIYFVNSVIWLNTLAGIRWCGVGLSLVNTVVEENQRGLWLDCTGSISPATSVNVSGSDFEKNELEQIKITPDGDKSAIAVSIDGGNNFVNTEENAGKSKAMIVIDNTGSKAISFKLGVNNYGRTDVHNIIEAHNQLYADCYVDVNVLDELKGLSGFKNLGEAKIRGLSNSRIINGLLDQKGIPFAEPGSSNNLVNVDNPLGYWRMPIQEFGYVRSIDMNFYTDATSNYSVQFELYRQTPTGGSVEFAAANVTKNGGGSGKITFNVGAGLDIGNHDSLLLKTTITKPASGTLFAVTNLVVHGSFA